VLYCFYSSDTEALEACFRLLHDDDELEWKSKTKRRRGRNVCQKN